MKPIHDNAADSKIDDCDNAKRYDKIFDKKTIKKFMVMMAIHYDFHRVARIEGEDFCSISTDLLASKRSVLAVNENCGGRRRSLCSGCGDGDKTPEPYLITAEDVNSL